MNALMEAVLTGVRDEPTALARARLQRQLPPEDAARRAGLTPDEVEWLEEGRLYRFRSSERATLALLLYATSLDIDRREARRLAGLPVGPLSSNPRGRIAVAAGVAALALAVVVAVVAPPRVGHGSTGAAGSSAALPPPWRISVDVLNGGGDIIYTRRVADRIGSFAYQIKRVSRAGRFDYPETSVYFPPGGERIGRRLAGQLGVTARPLPGGKNPRRLVVIVGPPRALS
jgi:LytR cell envelope-related transcriptional attenuator